MQPHTTYLICCLPRTGSWLLSEALQSTGIAGRPREYFGAELRRPFLSQWNLPPGTPFRGYLERVMEEATTPNGVLGIKVHWYQFEHLMQKARTLRMLRKVPDRAMLRSIFPNLQYIHLRRVDRIRHAVSYARAAETKLWWEVDRPDGLGRRVLVKTPRFNLARIDRMLELIQTHEQNWQHYFRQVGVTPLELFYEDFSSDCESAVRQVLDYLNVPTPGGRVTGVSRLRKQADDLSEAWVQRYWQIRPRRARAAETVRR